MQICKATQYAKEDNGISEKGGKVGWSGTTGYNQGNWKER